jgi:hypothetical protein
MVEQSDELSAQFEQFLQHIALTEAQEAEINSCFSVIRDQLKQLPYVTDCFITGGYKKKTLIQPACDIDLFVVMSSEQRDVVPHVVLNQLKHDLHHAWPDSVLRLDKMCMAINFDHCRFELVPAVMVGEHHELGFYIPLVTNNNDWSYVGSPQISETQLIAADVKLDGKLLPLLRMMKYCKYQNKINNISSWQMEQAALETFEFIRSYREGIQELLRVYGWVDSPYHLQSMADSEFGEFCRNMLFGQAFPD